MLDRLWSSREDKIVALLEDPPTALRSLPARAASVRSALGDAIGGAKGVMQEKFGTTQLSVGGYSLSSGLASLRRSIDQSSSSTAPRSVPAHGPSLYNSNASASSSERAAEWQARGLFRSPDMRAALPGLDRALQLHPSTRRAEQSAAVSSRLENRIAAAAAFLSPAVPICAVESALSCSKREGIGSSSRSTVRLLVQRHACARSAIAPAALNAFLQMHCTVYGLHRLCGKCM